MAKKELTREDPSWQTDLAVERMRALKERGDQLLARNAPEEERGAWTTTVDETMARAFGRNSPEFANVRSALVRYVLVSDAPDDFPKRLRSQLSLIAEYVRILQQRRDDDLRRRPDPQRAETPAVEKVLHLLQRFSRAAGHLKVRRQGRAPLLMDDEYDVQYLLHALLDVHFDDVRPEDPAPSAAGASTRIDFILEPEKIAVEAKRTRATLKDKEVGEELSVDIVRYQRHPSCRTLVCFVYDPDGYLRNPDGLERDLTKMHGDLDVRVVIRPKH